MQRTAIDSGSSAMMDGAQLLPYFAGWQRLGAIWIDSPRNLHAVTGESGGGSHRADLAALVCRGTVDAVTHVWIDDKEVWSGAINRGEENGVIIDLGDRGDATLFWGRTDQGFQPYLQAAGHPAYQGQCYLYLPQFLLNEGGGVRAPRVEVGLRRYPNVSWLPGVQAEVQGDANPAVALAERLTDDVFGPGLDAADFDQAQWAAVAAQLAAEDAVCSPLLSGLEAMDAREFAERLCGYFGGYLYLNAEGKLRLGLRREPPEDLTPLPTLTASHLVDAPEIEAADWKGAFNRAVVGCRDRTRGWKSDFGQWLDEGGYFHAGRGRIEFFERPWITRREAADALARRIGRGAAPGCRARLHVRASAAEGIGVGDWFALDCGDAGPGAALALQCTARRTPLDARPVVELEAEGRRKPET